jgi:hypothetical protein
MEWNDIVGRTAAFPPCFNILWPASAASGCVQATMPPVLWTTLLLLANCVKGGVGVGWTALADRVSAGAMMVLADPEIINTRQTMMGHKSKKNSTVKENHLSMRVSTFEHCSGVEDKTRQ